MIRNALRMLCVSAAALAALAGAATAQEVIKLKASHHLQESHGFQQDFLEPWAAELKKRTGGRVEIEIFNMASAFGHIDRQGDQVRAGVTDIAIGLNGIPRGRFPASSVIEMPFLVQHASSGSRALWTMYQEGMLGNEYDDFKVLALFTHNGGGIHMRTGHVATLENLQGKRIRGATPPVVDMLKELGASPVGLPPSEVYQNLQTGVMDGVVTTWALLHSAKLNELLPYHNDAKAYTVGFHVVMNKERYASLPEDVRNVIDELSGEALVKQWGGWWDKWDEVGIEEAKRRGHEIISMDPAERERWIEKSAPMIDRFLANLEKSNVPNARQIYGRAKELIAQYDAEAE